MNLNYRNSKRKETAADDKRPKSSEGKDSQRRRSSIDPNVKIPKELSLDKHQFILQQVSGLDT